MKKLPWSGTKRYCMYSHQPITSSLYVDNYAKKIKSVKIGRRSRRLRKAER